MTEFQIALILGGARSGKSTYGEKIARQAADGRLIYLATAEASDGEMQDRIAAHRERRGSDWHTIEEPVALAPHIMAAGQGDVILIDCLTLWLTNILLGDGQFEKHTTALTGALTSTKAKTVLVSNEVGLGIVPDNALSRRFRDEAGILNQRIAATADHVVLMTAGLPLILK